jgi:AcrR family transcriptional regulator
MTVAKRTRLSPHDRRMQLLDCSRTLIQSRGLSSFTMEALAREAGVSNPLVYKYFDTRLAVLQELLARETKRFNAELQGQITDASDYRELVTVVVSTNFDQFSSNNVITILRDQPDVYAAVAEDDKKDRGRMARYLVRALADQYTLSLKQAEQLVVLASGASQAAAAHYNRFGGDRAEMIDDTVEFIFGGIGALLP